MITPTDQFGTVALYEGDTMKILPFLPDGKVSLLATDPPYGMAFQSQQRVVSQKFKVIANDDAPFVWWLRDAARVLKDPGCLVCFCRWDSAEAFRLAIGWAGLEVRAQLIWDREVHGMGDLSGAAAPRHDTIWLAAKGDFKVQKSAGRPTSVYRYQKVPSGKLVHSNEKPLALMEQLVREYSPPGGLVLDPFLGSGTTGRAAVLQGRRFVGIELDQEYYALARDRIRAAVGDAETSLMR